MVNLKLSMISEKKLRMS